MPTRQRLLTRAAQAQSILIGTIVLGTMLAFGGAVWWARPALAVALVLLVLAALVYAFAAGQWSILKSPLAPLGALAVLLATVQLAPLPAQLAARLSPRSRQVHALGVLPDVARTDDPALELPEPAPVRTPISVDRPATLRWLWGGVGCLIVFCVVAHHADRLRHALVVWGAVVAALFLGTVFGIIQLVGGTEGYYGFLPPGALSGPLPSGIWSRRPM